MLKITPQTTLKRLRNHYRLVIMNDDTYEEVVTFRLSRTSVYATMSIAVILLAGFTIALLSFTNLKYLIPGYGSSSNVAEMRMLKVKTDSLEQVLVSRQRYLDGVQKMLQGNTPGLPLDTTAIQVSKVKEEYDLEKEEKPKTKRSRRRGR
jgi:hypothetical protein